MQTVSLPARVFYLIRFHDVELAEDFARRCPDADTIHALNNFFHFQFGQYSFECRHLRQGLLETDTFEQWSQAFLKNCLPSLRRYRFPPMTHLHHPALYSPEIAAGA